MLDLYFSGLNEAKAKKLFAPKQYVARATQRSSGGAPGDFKATWETWSVGSLGATLLAGAGGQRAQWAAAAPVLLPVPDCVRAAEAKEKAKVEARLAKMASSKARRKVDVGLSPIVTLQYSSTTSYQFSYHIR